MSMNTTTKVICTLGPASWSDEGMEKLLSSGMAIARFNFSHAWTHDARAFQKTKMLAVKEMAKKMGKACALALDTKGPDVRIGVFKDPSVIVKAGQTFKFYFGEKNSKLLGDVNGVFVDYEKLLTIAKVGCQFALNDGHVIMDITDIADSIITATVTSGGELKNNKSLAMPGYDLQLPFISDYDAIDFKLGIDAGVDWIFASAVARKKDLIELRALLDAIGGKEIKILSKIEDRIGIENLDDIIKLSDGVMVARGGLGTDIGLDKLPSWQKHIVATSRRHKKLVVVATEMMESMTEKPNCTRAEASDVANAVWDGADFVMLSSETAAGKYPAETVQFVYKIIEDAEKNKQYYRV